MMNPEQALFEAILQNPDDIAPRLIYADWCDEQGDPRGEFIRIQCELAAYEGLPVKVRHLRQREAELLQAHRRRWNGEIHRRLAQTPLANKVDSRHGWIRRWKYHRGFVEYAVVEARAFLEYPEAVFQIGPLRRLRVLNAEHDFKELMRSPFLKRLETVEVNSPNQPFEAVERRISKLSRSIPASTQIVPVQCLPTSPRFQQNRTQRFLGAIGESEAMLIFFGVVLFVIVLLAGLSILLGMLLETVILRLRPLFY